MRTGGFICIFSVFKADVQLESQSLIQCLSVHGARFPVKTMDSSTQGYQYHHYTFLIPLSPDFISLNQLFEVLNKAVLSLSASLMHQ